MNDLNLTDKTSEMSFRNDLEFNNDKDLFNNFHNLSFDNQSIYSRININTRQENFKSKF